MSDKIERYGWVINNEPVPERELIPKVDLHIDNTYQRNCNPIRTLKIAHNWSNSLVGDLSVNQRQDGRLFIMDGQHRWAAACARKDIYSLPCLVFHKQSVEEEADMFKALNSLVVKPNGVELYKSSIAAKDSDALAIQHILNKNSLILQRRSRGAKTISSIDIIEKYFKSDPILTEKILSLVAQLSVDMPVSRDVIIGLWQLNSRIEGGISNRRFNELILKSGELLISRSIEKAKIVYASETDRLALGVLAAVNHNLKKKIEYLKAVIEV